MRIINRSNVDGKEIVCETIQKWEIICDNCNVEGVVYIQPINRTPSQLMYRQK